MILKEVEFERRAMEYHNDDCCWLCCSKVDEVFGIDSKPHRIRLTVYDCKGKGRVVIRKRWFKEQWTYNGISTLWGWKTKKIFRNLLVGRRKFYVGVDVFRRDF